MRGLIIIYNTEELPLSCSNFSNIKVITQLEIFHDIDLIIYLGKLSMIQYRLLNLAVFHQAGVAADRIAIHSKGLFTDNLSPQNLISCDLRKQHGCQGGSINGAWSYLKKHGCVNLLFSMIKQKLYKASKEIV